MAKNKEKLVDEGFRVSLVETAIFDGKFEIPHIDAPDKIIIPNGMVPFSVRERSQDKKDFVCFYGNMRGAAIGFANTPNAFRLLAKPIRRFFFVPNSSVVHKKLQ